MAEGHEPLRHDPLPGILELPGHLWRLLGRRGHLAVGLAALALAVAGTTELPRAVRNGERNRTAEAAAARAAVRAQVAQLERAQRAHRASLPALVLHDPRGAEGPSAGRALERNIAAVLGFPTRCQLNTSRVHSAADALFSCFAYTDTHHAGTYDISFGRRLRARVRTANASLAWCREFPPPLHPQTQGYVTVPLPRDCMR